MTRNEKPSGRPRLPHGVRHPLPLRVPTWMLEFVNEMGSSEEFSDRSDYVRRLIELDAEKRNWNPSKRPKP